MNKLMMMWGMPCTPMEEAVGNDGDGGGGAPAPAATDPAATAPTEPASDPAADGGGADPKPFLGDGGNAPDGGDKTKDADPEPEGGKGFDEKAYIDGIKADPKIVGMDMDVDQEIVKAIAPTLSEIGVTPEQASKLANAMMKAQVEQQKAYLKDRIEYFNRMKEESMKRYGQADWKQINAGIDACFRKGGVMNQVVRNSELGADPEFLALMHRMGATAKVDSAAGAASGSGSGAGDGNSFDGMSRLW